MALKTDLQNMATKTDLVAMRDELKSGVKLAIAEAVDPLKEVVNTLENKVNALEARPATQSGGESLAASKEIAELQKLLQKTDPALRRIAFVGWPDSISADERLKTIGDFVVSKCGQGQCTSGNFYKGPYNNRTLTPASFAEFISTDSTQEAMKILKTAELNVGGKSIQMKMARTDVNSKRNYSLRKAEELLKGHSSAAGQEIKINWKTDEPGIRNVKVGQNIAFAESKTDLKGTFLAPFADLSF